MLSGGFLCHRSNHFYRWRLLLQRVWVYWIYPVNNTLTDKQLLVTHPVLQRTSSRLTECIFYGPDSEIARNIKEVSREGTLQFWRRMHKDESKRSNTISMDQPPGLTDRRCMGDLQWTAQWPWQMTYKVWTCEAYMQHGSRTCAQSSRLSELDCSAKRGQCLSYTYQPWMHWTGAEPETCRFVRALGTLRNSILSCDAFRCASQNAEQLVGK